MSEKAKDIIIRAAKTFAQAFLGIAIPECCIMLNGGFPESWSAAWMVLGPVIASALAAGISAAWNTINYYFNEQKGGPSDGE